MTWIALYVFFQDIYYVLGGGHGVILVEFNVGHDRNMIILNASWMGVKPVITITSLVILVLLDLDPTLPLVYPHQILVVLLLVVVHSEWNTWSKAKTSVPNWYDHIVRIDLASLKERSALAKRSSEFVKSHNNQRKLTGLIGKYLIQVRLQTSY